MKNLKMKGVDMQPRQPLKSIINFNQKTLPTTDKLQLKPANKTTFTLTEQDIKGFNMSLKTKQRHSLKSRPAQRQSDNCENHANKLAKFRVISDQLALMYCQKCAVLLASQGFRVQKLSHQNNLSLLESKGNNRYTQEARDFLGEIETFLQAIHKIKQHNLDEKQKVREYYDGFISKIQQFENEVKNRISLLMNQQKQQLADLFEDFDLKFRNRIKDIEFIEQELSVMGKDIHMNLQVISNLEQQQFRPIIVKYKQSLSTYESTIDSYNQIQYPKLEVVTPKADTLKSLAALVLECCPSVKRSEKNNMFFSFDKRNRQQSSTKKVNKLDANVDIKMTNSDVESEDERVLQESIVDEDFSKLMHL